MQERIKKFKELLGSAVTEEFTNWLVEKGFFTAPASTKYHGSYEGGLFDHSYAVAIALIQLTERCDLKWMRESSPALVGMFHDLCKIDSYRQTLASFMDAANTKPVYEYNNNTLLKGHGDKSILLLAPHLVLTEEEVLCIRYHMGAFVPQEEWRDYTNAIHAFQNVLWTHQADMIASHIMGI